ncbi:ankyrin repeat and LEM domain-containing protein 2-like [Tropilaelaps mercedesae]|uniref:Ankyrin repeat and LEM domain-containing protein 2-like n=1 Tax=Tropilaelaps mercedesae TaxID=418985 RepID=A0A1V9X029_9ACAR|nr:ankyrin repeat and LEM domain-containing protein 2-like [Tropilaelaps mercedesae]
MSPKLPRRRLGPSFIAVFSDLHFRNGARSTSKSAAVGGHINPDIHDSFFAVHIAGNRTTSANNDEPPPPYVFTDLPSAIQFCKRFKEGRFKKFASLAEAEQFSLDADIVPSTDGTDSQQSHTRPKSPDLPQSRDDKPKVVAEKSAFRAPRAQELVRLRRLVHEGDCQTLRDRVWANPRLLVGSGDNPTIVHEGARYNVFHCAARSNQSEILEVLMQLLRDVAIFKKLYPEDNEDTTYRRMAFLVGLYLNIPDKTTKGYTPLHFASSLGHHSCVAVLVRQPECNIDAVNGDGQTAFDVAGERDTSEAKEQNTLKIRKLLSSDTVIIPIFRDPVDLSEPELGAPLVAPDPMFDSRHPPLPVADRQQICDELKKTKKDQADVRLTDPDKGLENVARTLARRYGTGWNEYWSFLGCWADLASDEGVALLEGYLLNAVRRNIGGYSGTRDGDRRTTRNNGVVQSNGAPGRNSAGRQGDKNKVPPKLPTYDQKATAQLVKELYGFITDDILDSDEPPAEPPRGLVVTLPRSNHVEAVSSVMTKLFLSTFELDLVSSHIEHMLDQALEPRFDCLFTTLTGALKGHTSYDTLCSCATCIESSSDDDDKTSPNLEHQSMKPTFHELACISYITGPLPTRTDYQVWLAQGESLRDSALDAPCVLRWRDNMKAFAEPQMRAWKTPRSFRGRVPPQMQTPRPMLTARLRRRLGSPTTSYDLMRVSLESRFVSPEH